jgi:Domain of unknown function (DUF4349)
MRRVSLLTSALMLTMVLCTILLFSCAKMSQNSESPKTGIVLDSGLDKKGAAGQAGSWSDELVADPGWNEAPAEEAATVAGASDKDGDTPNVVTRPAADTLQRIGTWFSPAAYAADTHIDEKYLIRTGDINLSVDDFSKSANSVFQLAEKFGGIVTDSELSNSGDNERSGWITLRVPNTSFIAAFNELSKLGEVTSQTMNSEDVSRQYVAAVSRLRNLTLEQETLRKMLNEALAVQRARGLGEGYKILLDTQQRLSDVTGQIEATEDEISAFADKITRSTIKVNLTQAVKYEAEQFTWGMGATFDKSKQELLSVVRGLGQGLIHFGVVGWLYLLPWIIVGWILFRVYRKYVAPKLIETKALEV